MSDESRSSMAKFEGVAEIKHHAGPMLLPDTMTPIQAYKALGRLIKQQEEETAFNVEFECLPHDGAAALNRVLIKTYGWSTGIPTPGFFGPNPPEMMTVPTGVNTSIEVPWGRLALPNLDDGYLETNTPRINGVRCFGLQAVCKRKNEKFIKEEIFNKVAKELKEDSILRGKCFSISFTSSSGSELPIPEVKFIDLSRYAMDKLILPKDTERNMELSVWAPMRNHEVFCKEYGNLKRSVLMAGGYGTGKTLSASNTAKLGVEQGFTMVYCKKTSEFEKALRVARNYQNPVSGLIVEDIDIELSVGRSDALNQIINPLDGIDTKGDNIITLMTTNNLESLEPAAIRQGRVSAKIQFRNPDASAVQKLVKVNCGDLLSDDIDLSEVGETLDGMNPAEIEETCTVAKLAHLSATGKMPVELSSDDLLEASKYMVSQADIQRHIESLHNKPDVPTIDSVLSNIVSDKVEGAEENIIEAINDR